MCILLWTLISLLFPWSDNDIPSLDKLKLKKNLNVKLEDNNISQFRHVVWGQVENLCESRSKSSNKPAEHVRAAVQK